MPLSRTPWSVAVALALVGLPSIATAGPPTEPTTPGATSPPAPPSSSPPQTTTPPAPPRKAAAPPGRATPPAPSEVDGSDPVTVEPEQPPQDLSENWGYSKKGSTSPRYVQTDNPAVHAAPNPIGFYSGVSVAGNHVPPKPPESFDSKPAMLTWAGFERATEGSRVFFELNAEAQYSVERKGLTLQIRMRNTKVNVRNNMRALDLRYFKTPVRTVQVRRRGRDTTATIVLKHEAEPHVELSEGKAGYKLLVVQFADAIEPGDHRRTNPTTKPSAPYETGGAPPPPNR